MIKIKRTKNAQDAAIFLINYCLEMKVPMEGFKKTWENRDKCEFLIAYDEKKVVGGVGLVIEGDTCLCHSLWVAPEYRGKGIGGRIMLRTAKDLDLKKLTVKLVADLNNVKMYEKMGFETVSHIMARDPIKGDSSAISVGSFFIRNVVTS